MCRSRVGQSITPSMLKENWLVSVFIPWYTDATCPPALGPFGQRKLSIRQSYISKNASSRSDRDCRARDGARIYYSSRHHTKTACTLLTWAREVLQFRCRAAHAAADVSVTLFNRCWAVHLGQCLFVVFRKIIREDIWECLSHLRLNCKWNLMVGLKWWICNGEFLSATMNVSSSETSSRNSVFLRL